MTLQSSGAISLGNVNTELGRSSTAAISLGETAVRTLAGVSSGAIALSNLYGKSNVSFTPDGGTSAGTRVILEDYGQLSASLTISCTASAVWTWTELGSGTASVSSGGSATSITFQVSTTSFGGFKYSEFTVQATAGGITRYWTVNLTAEDFS
jgi:hypothetical protein